MPRFSFLKIIDEAIVPSLLAVSAKVAGALITQSNSGIFVNSISDLVLLLTIVAGFGWVLIKASHFHASHIHPLSAAKLARRGLSHLVEDSYEIYHQALVWFAILWFSFFLILVEAYSGQVYYWVAVAAVLVTASLTLILWEDIRLEQSLS